MLDVDGHVLGVPGPSDEHRYGYVKGHDGLLHCADHRGFILCGMGRTPSPVYVIVGPVSCLLCFLKPWSPW